MKLPLFHDWDASDGELKLRAVPRDLSGDDLLWLLDKMYDGEREHMDKAVATLNGWLNEGSGVAVYQHQDPAVDGVLSHQFVSFGRKGAHIESAEPPSTLSEISLFSGPFSILGTYGGPTLNRRAQLRIRTLLPPSWLPQTDQRPSVDAQTVNPSSETSGSSLEQGAVAVPGFEMVARYLKAFRLHDYKTMVALTGIHDGELIGGLVMCAGAVVPAFREVVSDDAEYLEIMDQWAHTDNGSPDRIRGIAVDMVNSQGGVPADNRWTSPGTTQMTAQMVCDVCFVIAALLNALIDGTAAAVEREPDEAFRYFIGLLRAPATPQP